MDRTFARSLVLVGLVALTVAPAAVRIESSATAADRVIADESAPDRLAQRCFTRNGRTVCF